MLDNVVCICDLFSFVFVNVLTVPSMGRGKYIYLLHARYLTEVRENRRSGRSVRSDDWEWSSSEVRRPQPYHPPKGLGEVPQSNGIG